MKNGEETPAGGHDRVRLSFSWPSPDQIREGTRRLAAAMERDAIASAR